MVRQEEGQSPLFLHHKDELPRLPQSSPKGDNFLKQVSHHLSDLHPVLAQAHRHHVMSLAWSGLKMDLSMYLFVLQQLRQAVDWDDPPGWGLWPRRDLKQDSL